jgi:Na+/melibiose symporter-like transporter
MAWFYPLTRERHAKIRRLLALRKDREAILEKIKD